MPPLHIARITEDEKSATNTGTWPESRYAIM